MKYFILCSLSFFMILNTHAFAEENKTEDFYGQFYSQSPKLIDCQSITIDEEFLKNDKIKTSKFEKLICFYSVILNDKITTTMWKEVGTNNFGFVK